MSRKRPDWDKEQRERRAREHGRERAHVDVGGEQELDDVVDARRGAEDDLFHQLVEPARRIAVGSSPREEKPALVAAAIDQAAASAPTQALAARIRRWWPRMLKRPSGSEREPGS